MYVEPAESRTDDHAESRVSDSGFSSEVRAVMDQNWVEECSFTAPNRTTYPWMWLWDSSFHSIVYATLGDERAMREARSIFRWQTTDGMVPHMGYQSDEAFGKLSWSGSGGSVITQPPMYGHMLRVLHSYGFDVSSLLSNATAGIRFLLDRRRLPSGLIGIVHPWESGTDNSPRWDGWCGDGANSRQWRQKKSRMVGTLDVNSQGTALSNPLFEVAPASFNALVAFNALELSHLTHDQDMQSDAMELSKILDQCFVPELNTWADSDAEGSFTSSVRTLDALLPALVSPNTGRVREILGQLADRDAFGADYGPTGVDKREVSFDPDAYWRGGAWPQLTYLLFIAAQRAEVSDVEEWLRSVARTAALKSKFAEFYNATTGAGRGAVPQSWSCLPVSMTHDVAGGATTPSIVEPQHDFVG
jgi:hypothetical protein